MRVRFEMVLELRIEYGEHESSSDAHLPNVIQESPKASTIKAIPNTELEKTNRIRVR